jgi:hypothetical protein
MIRMDRVIKCLRILRLGKWQLVAEISGKAVLERVIPTSRMVEATHKREKAGENKRTTLVQ